MTNIGKRIIEALGEFSVALEKWHRPSVRMYPRHLPLWVCKNCGLKLYTWDGGARADRLGCPGCQRRERE